MKGKTTWMSFAIIVLLLISAIPAVLAGYVPGTTETVKISLMDAANPGAAPVTYPDGQQYREINATVGWPHYAVGESFTVWVNVTDVTELNLYQVGLYWDSSILTCTSYDEGEFFYRAPEEYRTASVNQPMGRDNIDPGIAHAMAWVLALPGNVSGTGTIAVADFTVAGWGVTKIEVTVAGAEATGLGDADEADIDYNTIEIVFDNFELGQDHELRVSLEAPDVLKPDESSLLNATVYNIGSTNETDVELQLLINGTVKKSETIDELENGTSYTIDYLWTPTTEATYNVTAYVAPVTGEGDTENNVDTKLVLVPYSYWCINHPVVWDDVTYYVRTCSNATVSDFTFSQPDKNVSFNLAAPPYIPGLEIIAWCNVTIPKALLDAPPDRWVVQVEGQTITTRIISSNDTHTRIDFTCQVTIEFPSAVDITGTIVIPEFPAAMLLLLFMIATLLVVTLRKINQPKRRKTLPGEIGFS